MMGNIQSISRDKLINKVDKSAVFFFAVLIFFLPISNAVIESCFGFIFLCFILRSIWQKPNLKDIKTFFENRINLSLLFFYIVIGLSVFINYLVVLNLPLFVISLILCFILLMGVLDKPTLKGIKEPFRNIKIFGSADNYKQLFRNMKILLANRVSFFILLFFIIVAILFFKKTFWFSRFLPLLISLMLALLALASSLKTPTREYMLTFLKKRLSLPLFIFYLAGGFFLVAARLHYVPRYLNSFLLCLILLRVFKGQVLEAVVKFCNNKIKLPLFSFYTVIGILLAAISFKNAEVFINFIFLFFILVTILRRPLSKEIEIFCKDVKTFFTTKIKLYQSTANIKTLFTNKGNLSLLIMAGVLITFLLSLKLEISSLFEKSFRAWFFKWGEGILLFYFAQVFLTKQDIKFLLKIFFASVFLITLDGLCQKITGVDFIRGSEIIGLFNYGLFSITASFDHYNDFAAFLLIAFFLNCFVLIGSNKELRIYLFLLLPLIVTNFLFTYSRGAWVAFLITSFLSILLFTNKKVKLSFLFLLLIFILTIDKVPLLSERFSSIIKYGKSENRLDVWIAAISMFKEAPLFGKGVGLFTDYFRQHLNLFIQYTHNCYLQILAETGILGLLSFLWFLGELLVRAYRKLIKNGNFLAAGLFFGILAFLIHAFFDTHLYSLRLSILFWLITAFLSIYINGVVANQQSHRVAAVK